MNSNGLNQRLKTFSLLAHSFALLASFACSKKKENPTPTPQDTTKKVYPNKLMGGVWKLKTSYVFDTLTKRPSMFFDVPPLGKGYINFLSKDSLDVGYTNKGAYNILKDTVYIQYVCNDPPTCRVQYFFALKNNSSNTEQLLELFSPLQRRVNKDGDSFIVQNYYLYTRSL